ncbi:MULTISPECIES: response regulator transcription factor [unclassified Pseudonocardia]|uniref:response regulator transcription factor n=1 Tax=unclassified Pseudonocardia TaxID=2619320 RepID=UPI000492334C|nr:MULTISPECIES: response regulator transcription factor [unclassified Pseudonocardia]ALE75211.1 transcriptional regulator [Pseudonocardia sp. EC080625-04]ALL74574.1 transcriptional regulator [Pseudonocardia sp. EC080610-09]ALL81594.1 transcriptional regulator [Pseudonocardia sp. EC080619-01]OLM16158.1 putative two-component system response regulator [Pseudonocardia sp. Ae707_Ps1]
MRVLLVEDDDGVASAVGAAFDAHAILYDRVSRGSDAFAFVAFCDVVVLDLGLPDVDGIELCRQLRQCRLVPVVITTARGDVEDRILGLDSGAVDYIVKPFHVDELLARLRATLRPRPALRSRSSVVVAGDVEIDLASYRVFVGGDEVLLGTKELQLLVAIAEADGSVCTRRRLIAQIWGRWWSGADRTLDTNIATLRRKLGRTCVIETIRGVGYRLAVTTDRSRRPE